VALKMTDREVDGASVVALDGRIVMGAEGSALREKLKNLISEGKKRIVLNMNHIEYIDSSGLGTLVSAAAEKPSVTLPGTVDRIIQSPDPKIPEKAEISVQGAEELYQEIRIENTLTDEHGDEVRLKKGAHVEVTVEAELAATTSTSANSKT
jgi:anti-anti-sigma factor